MAKKEDLEKKRWEDGFQKAGGLSNPGHEISEDEASRIQEQVEVDMFVRVRRKAKMDFNVGVQELADIKQKHEDDVRNLDTDK